MSDVVAELIATISADVSGLADGIDQSEGLLSGLSQKMQDVGAKMTAGLTVPIVGFGIAAVKAAGDEETALSRLNSALKNTSSTTGVTAGQADKLAKSLSDTTQFSKLAVMQAEDITAGYTQIGKTVFPRVTQAAADMAAQLGGDLVSNTQLLDRALAAPSASLGRLTRAGIIFTTAEKEKIKALEKSGNLLGAQNIILNKVEARFKGAAEAAGTTFAGKMAILNNKFTDFQVQVGNILLPIVEHGIDILSHFFDIIGSIPQPILEIGVAIFAAIAAIGPILTLLGTLGTVLAFVISPVGLLIAGVVALAAAFITNFGGIRDAVMPIIDVFVSTLASIWSIISPALNQVKNWFVDDVMPRIGAIIQNDVIPFIADFIDVLAAAWEQISPSLTSLANWFVKDALPAVEKFITGTILPAIDNFIKNLKRIWDDVAPNLLNLEIWFTQTALPAIGNAINGFITGFVDPVISVLQDVWTLVEPYLTKLGNWFLTDVLPAIGKAISDFNTNVVQPVIKALQQIWDYVSPKLVLFAQWFHDNLPGIKQVWDQTIGLMIKDILSIPQHVQDALDALGKLPTQIGQAFSNPGSPQAAQTANGLAGAGKFFSDPIGTLLNGIMGGITGHANGGNVGGNAPILVGERGPELFTPNSSGFITPNGAIGGSGGGGFNGVIHMTLDAGDFKQNILYDVNDSYATAR